MALPPPSLNPMITGTCLYVNDLLEPTERLEGILPREWRWCTQCALVCIVSYDRGNNTIVKRLGMIINHDKRYIKIGYYYYFIITIFKVFGMTRSGYEPEPPVKKADSLKRKSSPEFD